MGMKPSFFSNPATFAAIPDPEVAAGAGAVAGLVEGEAQPAAALDRSAKENAEALFIVNRE
jgi:hypothetical protein